MTPDLHRLSLYSFAGNWKDLEGRLFSIRAAFSSVVRLFVFPEAIKEMSGSLTCDSSPEKIKKLKV